MIAIVSMNPMTQLYPLVYPLLILDPDHHVYHTVAYNQMANITTIPLDRGTMLAHVVLSSVLLYLVISQLYLT